MLGLSEQIRQRVNIFSGDQIIRPYLSHGVQATWEIQHLCLGSTPRWQTVGLVANIAQES